jgi:hypothetical protein
MRHTYRSWLDAAGTTVAWPRFFDSGIMTPRAFGDPGGSFRTGFEQGALKYVGNIPLQSKFGIATTFSTLWKDLPGHTNYVYS